MRRMDRSAEFISQLEALRVKYKIKRNFIKGVEQERKIAVSWIASQVA